jgi:hypothetical protein
MRFPNKEQVKRVRQTYPRGAKVTLVRMNDPYAEIAAGTVGVVTDVDDTGTVFVDWQGYGNLGAVYGEDEIRLLSKSEVIKWEARRVAATGRTNMFDAKTALDIAFEMGFGELAGFIATDAKAYGKLILTGELNDDELKGEHYGLPDND